MTLEQDDTRLTAYALGELAPHERLEVEAWLERDARARAELDTILEVSQQLERELRAPGVRLSNEQREQILSSAGQAVTPATAPRRRWRWRFLLAALVPCAGLVWLLGTPMYKESVQWPAWPTGEVREQARVVQNVDALLPRMAAPYPVAARAEAPVRALVQAKQKAAASTESAPSAPESYSAFEDNPFVRVSADPRSTFSIDVDTASYALVRRMLQSGERPPKGAVRDEELLNYFSYQYPEPQGDAPFSVVAGVARAPWAPEHKLVRIGLKARHVAEDARPVANLVFLIDVSGSMATPDKLPLVKYGLQKLTQALAARDRVSIVVYAGASGVVLDAAPGSNKQKILDAIELFGAGGSTNGGEGIERAYALARQHFARGGVNRVILATDGDFNVGVTSQSELIDLIQREAKSGVFLSVLGVGRGNYRDTTLEMLADKGNGNYAYIDDSAEARKVLVEQLGSTLVTVAKDVKVQLEFNPSEVEAYRLIGYENRKLEHQDFNDDAKDAGEIGADHTVTALYEVIPTGGSVPGAAVDALKYQTPGAPAPTAASAFAGELLQVKLRYQPPAGGPSQLIELPVRGDEQPLLGDFGFAVAVAQFGMLLRESPARGAASYASVLELARASLGNGRDREAREQFLELVQKASKLSDAPRPVPPRPCNCPPGDPLCSCL